MKTSEQKQLAEAPLTSIEGSMETKSMGKSRKVATVLACLFFVGVVLFHAIVGIALFPWFLVTKAPDAPLSQVVLFLVDHFGMWGFLGFYALPLVALSGWSVNEVLALTKKNQAKRDGRPNAG